MTSWSAVTWETARAGGFAAYALLTLAVVIGLILRNRLSSERWPRVISYELHGYVSLLALVFLSIHVLAVAVDPFTHFGLGELIVPFVSHYRPPWMGLGIVALYLLLAVWVTTRLRMRIGHQAWRRLHGLAFAVYAAATVHGLGAGSDTRTSWGTAVYVISVLLVVGLSTRRLLVPAGSGSRPRPVLAAAAGAAAAAVGVWAIAGPYTAGWGKHVHTVQTAAATPVANRAAVGRRRMRQLERKLARARRGSNRRARVKLTIARLRARETDRRRDWVEKASTDIARRFNVIRVEDLQIKEMIRSARGTRENPGRNVRQKSGSTGASSGPDGACWYAAWNRKRPAGLKLISTPHPPVSAARHAGWSIGSRARAKPFSADHGVPASLLFGPPLEHEHLGTALMAGRRAPICGVAAADHDDVLPRSSVIGSRPSGGPPGTARRLRRPSSVTINGFTSSELIE